MTRIPTPAAIALLALSALYGAAPALAAEAHDATALRARNQAAACTNCHGPEGRAPAGSPIPGLAGRPRSQLVAQMQAFKAGTRQATVMHQIARGYSDEQINAIAAWFAAVR
jgi:cytochrome c553